MLTEYQLNPAFTDTKEVAFAYQPAPEIDITKLPILPDDWLDNLQKIICEADDKLPKNIFDKHLGVTSDYRGKIQLLKQLQLIFHRLQGNLDSELGKLLPDNRQALISKLTEEIIHCSEGFHNRVNSIVDPSYEPADLKALVSNVRNNLVEKVAVALTDEVHAQNRVSVVAASDGLGTKVNFPDDTYVGALSDISIRRALQHTFYKQFTPFHLPCLLIAAFMEFIPELEVEKNRKNGLSLHMSEKIISLIKRFLPNHINEIPKDPNHWLNYFIIFRDKNNPLNMSIVNLNWEKMYRSFFDALSEENYFKDPQINTLTDCAYYNLFLRKKSSRNPAKLILRLFKSVRYAELLEQLAELNTRFPNYYKKECKIQIPIRYCLSFIDYLIGQLKISSEYSEEIMQGFHLIIQLKNKAIIGKIADTFLVRNQNGFNPLMLAAFNNPTLLKDILAFLKTHESIIASHNPEIPKKIFLMKNKAHLNALMIAAVSKQAETIVSILDFLTTHIGSFANDTLRKLFTQQQKDSYTAVTLTARDQPRFLGRILSFIRDHIIVDGETLRKLFFAENSNGTCMALMLAVKSQADATYSILKFISENIKSFDPKILSKMFLEKDQNGFSILMLAARYQPKALGFILEFIGEYEEFFPAENLPAFFLEKNFEEYNCLMLAAEYQPMCVPTIINFINNRIESFKPHLEKILFTRNKKGCHSLMLARHHPEAMTSIIHFIHVQPKGVISVSLKQIFLEKHNLGFTLLMLIARDHAKSLNFIFEFLLNKPILFPQKTLPQLIFDKNELEYNCLMLVARNQAEGVAHILNFILSHPDIFSQQFINELLLAKNKDGDSVLMIAARYQLEAVKLILSFIQKQPKTFSPAFVNELLLAQDQYGVNALMKAATYQPNAVELLLSFLTLHINHMSNDALQEFIFKNIRDREAAAAVFFGGRYDYKKSVLSVTAQCKDGTAIKALLKFIDNHIELIGIKIFIHLLKEKDQADNPIFLNACSKYFFPMKKTLNFIATLPDFEELAPIQHLVADFIFEQLARWPVASKDKSLFYKVTYNYSTLLLNYFNADRFTLYPDNLDMVAKILFCGLQNKLEHKKAAESNQYFFFRWLSSTEQELQASQELEKILYRKEFSNMLALKGFEDKYSKVLKSNPIFSCLFSAFKKTDTLKAENVYNLDLENDAVRYSPAKFA
ncbi:MAG: hypothetical protein WA659_01615 [Candidatus Aquirickettsiella sp.]